MSERYPGGIISKTAPTPTGPYENGTAPGIWSLEQQMQYQQQGIWPIAGNVPPYIEDVFSTYLYTGNGSTQTITNGIDLSGKGGLVWIKARSAAYGLLNWDTSMPYFNNLSTYNTDALINQGSPYGIASTSATGFATGNTNWARVNESGTTYASWTFRKQPKFFDVVTYTGNDTAGRTIAHNLGSVPGCIIVKATNSTLNWFVYHRSLGNTKSINLNLTSAATTVDNWGNTTPTSTVFTVDSGSETNQSGVTYVAYLFAHDAGGFGLTGTDNVISCGSFTTDGSGNATVSLGYEPQWVLMKPATTSASGSWIIADNMRGWNANGPSTGAGWNGNQQLYANLSSAESGGMPAGLNSTGFDFLSNGYSGWFNQTWIYIAIRRGPMKVPTSGTSVFGITTAAGTSPAYVSSFPVDVALRKQITGGDPTLQARLTGETKMFTDYTFAEGSDANVTWYYQNGMFTTTGANANQYGYLMRRAPSYMDVVCYTGTGSGVSSNTVNHNLGVVPELCIFKCRSNSAYGQWGVSAKFSSTDWQTGYLYLTGAFTDEGDLSSFTPSTATTIRPFYLMGGNGNPTVSGQTYVAYLFATCAGVSKVGTYTGTGALQTINCGFTGGARFVLIKRTDSTGDWYVYDTSNGMTSGNDPYWLINDAAAQVTGTNYVDTDSTGFKVTAAAPAGLNASGGTYIFLAIA